MVLVLLTLIPAQAAGETGTGTDEGEKTYTVTLNGNGGSLNGDNEVKVTYSSEKLLDFGEYCFTQRGYALVGWSEDSNGDGAIFERSSSHYDIKISSGVLYAVWLKLPESGNYAIFNTAGAGTIADAVSNANDLYCVELTENFKMPTLQRSDTTTAAHFIRSGALLRSRRTCQRFRSSMPSGNRSIILRTMYRW